MEKVPGNDVSEYQGEIDWPKVYTYGQRFVFIKATEGDYRHDKTFLANWAGTKSAGLLRGAYHFFRCDVDATTQADYFINFVKSTNDNGELPPCLDFETNEGKTKVEIVPMVKVWLDRVAGAFGRKPIIYSGFYNLQDNLTWKPPHGQRIIHFGWLNIQMSIPKAPSQVCRGVGPTGRFGNIPKLEMLMVSLKMLWTWMFSKVHWRNCVNLQVPQQLVLPRHRLKKIYRPPKNYIR